MQWLLLPGSTATAVVLHTTDVQLLVLLLPVTGAGSIACTQLLPGTGAAKSQPCARPVNPAGLQCINQRLDTWGTCFGAGADAAACIVHADEPGVLSKSPHHECHH